MALLLGVHDNEEATSGRIESTLVISVTLSVLVITNDLGGDEFDTAEDDDVDEDNTGEEHEIFEGILLSGFPLLSNMLSP